MIRFLLGAAVGAVIVALVQFRFGPIPTLSGDRPVAPEPEASVSDVASRPPSRAENAAGGKPANRTGTPKAESSAAAEEAPEAPEAEQPSGPLNPIQLPESHAGFVRKSARSLPDEHTTLENEEVDQAWAELVESLIYSHIATHPRGAEVSIVSLVCRSSRCEIAGTVYTKQGGAVWREVLSDMQAQPWFATNFEQSMFGAGGGLPGEHRFLTMLARVGTEISPPVAP